MSSDKQIAAALLEEATDEYRQCYVRLQGIATQLIKLFEDQVKENIAMKAEVDNIKQVEFPSRLGKVRTALKKKYQTQIDELKAEVVSKQATIDSLMLEYCPDEMTQSQMDEWASHQAPVKSSESYDVITILDSGEWRLIRNRPASFLTDEGNAKIAWSVERQFTPYWDSCGKKVWYGKLRWKLSKQQRKL